MHIHFSPQQLGAIRLAAILVDCPNVESFVRDAAMHAVRVAFADGVPVVAAERPLRGQDILVFTGRE